ncbi:MAG: class I SAM-dependent methyltransferase [Saprospiraceae bacterium]|nr:class I SAM-dependent methyltransferase [Saprospiraceae bacterium]
MASETYGLTPEIQQYLRDLSVREHPAQVSLRAETDTMEQSVMSSSPEMGNFMQLLIGMIGASRCLEVGVFTGYGTLSMALAVPDDGLIRAFDISEEWTSVGVPYWREAGVEHKIDLRLGAAGDGLRERLDAGEAGSYDFAFIDADKVNYPSYYRLCMELIRPGGIVLLDNTLWNWDVADPSVTDPDTEAIRKVNQIVFDDPRVQQSIVPFGDGCTLVVKLRD